MTIAENLEPEVVEMARALNLLAERGGKVDAVSSIAPALFSAAISLKRIADALDERNAVADKVPQAERDEGIRKLIAQGLSLRETAKRYGVGVGRVRGAIARGKESE